MGVWSRSQYGRKVSQENIGLYEEYGRSLPDWKMDDLPGSPYCIKEYSVDKRFGGNTALSVLRSELNRRGIKLILDFVPNHIALDHNWSDSHPEYLISGDEFDIVRSPREFFQTPKGVFSKGRDPFFAPWQDVAQLNAYSSAYRKAACNDLKQIGRLCDGVRCDMAMLMLNRVFSYTWQNRAGVVPATEYWEDIIPTVQEIYPEIIFIAEAYWGLEWDLQQVGFDFCYDKRLYDRLIHESTEAVRQHLQADFKFQSKLLRFIENHDEARAAEILSIPRLKAASVLITTLPGACLLYEGQWIGRKTRNHVLLGRRQPESVNIEILSFYRILLPEIKKIPSESDWQLCSITGWSDNQSCYNLLAYTWTEGHIKILIVVNFSEFPSQGRIHIPWQIKKNGNVEFVDLFGNEPMSRSGNELTSEGLFVDLPAWGFHFFYVN